MKDKSKLTAVILVVLTILVVVLTYIFDKDKEQNKNEIKIVTNYSNFYTVNSCLYRTITHISTSDKESLLLLLDNNYKKENKIDESNVLDLFSNIDVDSNFASRKMYYEILNNNITKYYVYGYVEKNQISDDEIINKKENKEMYFIVYLDSTNKTFSIEPYNGDIFIGGDKNE